MYWFLCLFFINLTCSFISSKIEIIRTGFFSVSNNVQYFSKPCNPYQKPLPKLIMLENSFSVVLIFCLFYLFLSLFWHLHILLDMAILNQSHCQSSICEGNFRIDFCWYTYRNLQQKAQDPHYNCKTWGFTKDEGTPIL